MHRPNEITRWCLRKQGLTDDGDGAVALWSRMRLIIVRQAREVRRPADVDPERDRVGNFCD
jgi:hypothetical protein